MDSSVIDGNEENCLMIDDQNCQANENYDDAPMNLNNDAEKDTHTGEDAPSFDNTNSASNNGSISAEAPRNLSPNTDDRKTRDRPGRNTRSRSRSRSRDNKRPMRNRRSGGGGGGGERSRSRSRSKRRNNRDGSRDRRRDHGGRSSGRHNGPSDKELGLKYRWERTIYISNIAYDVRWTELKDLFREKVTDDIIYCEIFESNGKSMGVGAMEFKNSADAERAVEIMNQYELSDRKISVRLDREGFKTRQAKETAGDYRNVNNSNGGSSKGSNNRNGSSRHSDNYRSSNGSNGQNSSNYGSNGYSNSYSHTSSSFNGSNSLMNLLNSLGGGSMMGQLNANMYGGSNPNMDQTNLLNQLAAQLKVDGPVTNRIFVASLDYKVDEEKLREVYSLAGNVQVVSLFRDRDHRSRGMAIVEYDTPLEALNAVSMFNNQQLMDRTMTVRFDAKPSKDDDMKPPAKLPSGLKSIGSGIGSLLQPVASNLAASQNNMTNNNQMNNNNQQNNNGMAAYTSLNSMSAMNNNNNANNNNNSNSSNQNNSALPDLTSIASLAGLTTTSLNSILNNLGIATSNNNNSNNNNMLDNNPNSGNMNNSNHMNGLGMNSYNSTNNIPSYKTASYNSYSQSSSRICKIFVKNIPFSWDDRKLQEKFRQAGMIEFAEVKMRDGKSKGCGIIQFSSPDQANKAVELFNGSRFEGRTLEVKIDQMA